MIPIWTAEDSVWEKEQIDGGRYSPVIVIDHRVSLKTPQFLGVFLYPLKCVAKK